METRRVAYIQLRTASVTEKNPTPPQAPIPAAQQAIFTPTNANSVLQHEVTRDSHRLTEFTPRFPTLLHQEPVRQEELTLSGITASFKTSFDLV